jgi:hypothetical protein
MSGKPAVLLRECGLIPSMLTRHLRHLSSLPLSPSLCHPPRALPWLHPQPLPP